MMITDCRIVESENCLQIHKSCKHETTQLNTITNKIARQKYVDVAFVVGMITVWQYRDGS